jgi:hypothetical protein
LRKVASGLQNFRETSKGTDSVNEYMEQIATKNCEKELEKGYGTRRAGHAEAEKSRQDSSATEANVCGDGTIVVVRVTREREDDGNSRPISRCLFAIPVARNFEEVRGIRLCIIFWMIILGQLILHFIF